MRQHEDDGDDLDRVGEDVRPEPPDLPGYRVGAHLGSGASGMVWAVTRAADDARLAAKVLLAPVEEACSETAFLQRLEHEHVLRLHDTVLDTSGPVPRLAMITDLAEGGSLGTAVAGRGHLTVGEVVTVLTPLARTLHDLHGQGLVHGDLSPANVLLDAHGKPLLADFGVARLAAGDDAQLWGTTGFVAPEVLAGERPEPAADVFALGALAWTCLVGEAPGPAALRPHLPDVAPQAPPQVCDLVLSCLAHTPEARPSAGELALALWDAAPAEPAPVPGSEGSRAAPTPLDPWSGLTQRIRESATAPEPEAEVAWHRLPAVRRSLLVAAVAGLVAGLVVVWPAGSRTGESRVVAGGSAPAPAATPAARARPSIAPVPPRESRTTPPRESRPAPRGPSAQRTPGTSAGPDRPQPSSPAPTAAPVGQDPTATLRADPRAVVQGLVDQRAKAWGSGRGLDAALVVDSAAFRSDAADLRSAASMGVSYRGLSFRVREARLSGQSPGRRGGDRVDVVAVIDRSAYRVEGAAPARFAASAGQRVRLTLQRTPQGWRIADWRAA
ncbi:serine/threonine protein kinase [Barrientosiimonas humi]|uniref:serine/threonine protein kinase n=1 Tax=Barrientosiimonas humi TaxID=999931 RepID=UPI00370D117D